MSDTGCKYCKTSEDGTCNIINFENPSNSSENYDIQFVFNSIDISKKFGDGVVATFSTPIKYCPFCGRKLFEDKKNVNDARDEILKRDFSVSFVEKMKNAIETSHYKYGWASRTYPELAQAYKCIKERLELYTKTHNKDYLVDVANFAMTEFLYPAFKDARYSPTDSDKSPGLAGGVSYKELMEFDD